VHSTFGGFFYFWNLLLLLSPSLFGHYHKTLALELKIFYYLLAITIKASALPYDLFVEQDALMSPNPRGKLEDLAAGCVCVV